jgi:sarcosine oxidase subunit alpha
VTGSLRLGRQRVPVEDGDSIASALHRAGVRTYTRSLKHHRRRGLSCGTGECPNCLLTVDGVPGVRACVMPAISGMRVERERGWPSAERDVLGILDRLHGLIPVGFYHKTFIRPRWAWRVADRLIRATVGVGRLGSASETPIAAARHLHCDVLVVGAGSAGRTAAVSAADRGERVMLCDQGAIEDPPEGVEILEAHAAIGLYLGPMVALASDDELVEVHPRWIVVATGATETHPVFPGVDLPGVMLGRAAVGLMRRGVKPGERAVVVAGHDEGIEHLRELEAGGVHLVAAVVPPALASEVPDGVRVLAGAEVLRAEGKDEVRFAVVRDADGVIRGLGCDAFVLSTGLSPRDDLLRMRGPVDPVEVVGDAAAAASPTTALDAGYVCLCEDVSVGDLERAWAEGFRSSELLKRYTTTAMGPCQGAMCGRHLAAFAAARSAAANAAGRTTARPLARPVPLAVLAGAGDEPIDRRTGLHEVHLAAGARVSWSGSWLRPFSYGDPDDEYRAVRDRVSLMDVGTLAKFLITGPDATTLVDVSFPTRIDDLAAGRARYLLALDEAGYVFDDGVLCSVGEEGWYLTSSSGGADRMEAWVRDHADRRALRVHVIDLTADRGAILVAGPLARELLTGLVDEPIDAAAFPHLEARELTVAGVPCGTIRTGFVGEVAYELHHARSRGPELWHALLEAGEPMGIAPHGLDALEVLRLEKGHPYVGQDTLPDDTPTKLGLAWAVDASKDAFVGRRALERLGRVPLGRKLVGLGFDRGGAELRGVPLFDGKTIRGRVTSAARSPVLDRTIGLGWLRARDDGTFPTELRAGKIRAEVVPRTFYDPEGARLRG